MEVIAKNKISGRVAQAIVAEVNKCGQRVLFRKDDRTINAGSLLGILSLVINPGDAVEVSVEGDMEILRTIQGLL